MRYYLGHWQWTTGNGMACFAPPAGVVGCLDLGTLPQMSVGGADRGRLLCWTQDAVSLPSEYELLGVGDCRELNTDGAMLDKFQSLVGYRPQGAKLVDAVWDCLEGGADIDGENGPLPLVPTTRGNLELHFAGHSVVKSRRFKWGKDAASPKLKQLLRKEFRGLLQDAKAGKLKDDKHAFRVLDYWCDKYGVSDWREFVPANLQKDVPGRVKHETTISDNFNRADSTNVSTGAPFSWTEVIGNAAISSNELVESGGACRCRADSDLSSADHYSQCVAASVTAPWGTLTRYASAADTCYAGIFQGSATNTYRIFKVVTGSATLLNTVNTTAVVVGSVCKLESNGSAHKTYDDGAQVQSITDTSITGNLRCGVQVNNIGARIDDFQAADLAAGGGLLRRMVTEGLFVGAA